MAFLRLWQGGSWSFLSYGALRSMYSFLPQGLLRWTELPVPCLQLFVASCDFLLSYCFPSTCASFFMFFRYLDAPGFAQRPPTGCASLFPHINLFHSPDLAKKIWCCSTFHPSFVSPFFCLPNRLDAPHAGTSWFRCPGLSSV